MQNYDKYLLHNFITFSDLLPSICYKTNLITHHIATIYVCSGPCELLTPKDKKSNTFDKNNKHTS